ncbi:MAG: hypothetical protein ABSG14_15025 [Verrucomicrobiia bacterium]|jgi:hypothetical protein
MKQGRFTLQSIGVVVIVVLFLIELAIAFHLSYAKSSENDDSGSAETGVSQAIIPAGTAQAAFGPQLDPPGEMEDTNSADEQMESLDAPLEIDIGDYTVKTENLITNHETVAELEVWKGQTLVYRVEGNRFELAGDCESDDGTTNAYFEPGVNVTGNGIPNLIVTDYSGGMHCCLTYYIFELGDEFRLVDTIPAEHGTIDFKDVDGGGIPVIKMSDWSYAYVFGCFASSPAPDVILRYTKGHYEIAPELMQTPTPDAAKLQQMVDEIKSNYPDMIESGGLTDEQAAEAGLWQKMLDLIYGGHEDEARRLYDMAWPAEAEGKDEALSNFVEAVTNSTYWQAVYGDEEEQEEKAVDNSTSDSQPATQPNGNP